MATEEYPELVPEAHLLLAAQVRQITGGCLVVDLDERCWKESSAGRRKCDR